MFFQTLIEYNNTYEDIFKGHIEQGNEKKYIPSNYIFY